MKYRITFCTDGDVTKNLILHGVADRTYAKLLDDFRRLITSGGYFETKDKDEGTTIIPSGFIKTKLIIIDVEE